MKPLLPKVDAVLFDLDGTLVDTFIDFPLMKRRMLDMGRDYGIDTSEMESLDILAIVDRMVEQAGEDADRLRSEALSALEEIEMRHAAGTVEVPFARDLLECLRLRGIRVGIVTRNCRAASALSVHIAGVEPDVMICREDTARHKPHPEQLLRALEQLGVDPGAAVMVGDHLMDVQGGKAAGLATIGFLRDSRPNDFFDAVAPDLVVRSLAEVRDAVVDCDS